MSTDVQVRPKANAAGESSIQAAIAEVQASMLVAQNRPRNEQERIDAITVMCTRPKLAETATYCYARGGQDITGPSIRLAEAIALKWYHIHHSWRVVESNSEESLIEVWAIDLEANVKDSKTFTVPHYRHTKKGKTRLDDPRDIYELQANMAARRKRACILAVIPADVVEAAVEQCEATLKTTTSVTPERIRDMVAKFAAHDVSREMIEKRIQRRIDAINAPLMITLGKIFTSIKDGMSSPKDWFEVAAPAGPQSDVAERLAAGKTKSLPSAKADPQPAPDDVHQGEAAVDESQAGEPSAAEFTEADKIGISIEEATSKVQFVALTDRVNAAYERGSISEQERAALHNLIKTCRAKK